MAGYRTTAAPLPNVARGDRGARAACRPRHHTGSSARFALALLMVAASLVAVLGHRSPAPGVDVTRFETIAVTEGGSLWQIATEYPVPGLGTPETVELIRTANRLDTAIVHVGQTIRVPVPTPPGTSLASR